jgi:hypothetical protein
LADFRSWRWRLLPRLAGSAHPLDSDQSRRSTAAQKVAMSFYPRQISIIELAGIATIILSVAVVVGMLYSLWAAS